MRRSAPPRSAGQSVPADVLDLSGCVTGRIEGCAGGPLGRFAPEAPRQQGPGPRGAPMARLGGFARAPRQQARPRRAHGPSGRPFCPTPPLAAGLAGGAPQGPYREHNRSNLNLAFTYLSNTIARFALAPLELALSGQHIG